VVIFLSFLNLFSFQKNFLQNFLGLILKPSKYFISIFTQDLA
jgi:hypothetical protein